MNKHQTTAATQLNLKDPETRALAEKVAHDHNTTLNGAVKAALQEKLARDERAREERLARVMTILEQYWAAPVADPRTADEILGYDENGLPT